MEENPRESPVLKVSSPVIILCEAGMGCLALSGEKIAE